MQYYEIFGGDVPNAPLPGCAPSAHCAAVTRDLVFQK